MKETITLLVVILIAGMGCGESRKETFKNSCGNIGVENVINTKSYTEKIILCKDKTVRWAK